MEETQCRAVLFWPSCKMTLTLKCNRGRSINIHDHLSSRQYWNPVRRMGVKELNTHPEYLEPVPCQIRMETDWGMIDVGIVPQFLKTRGYNWVLVGCKGIEKSKDRGQVVDKINRFLGFSGRTGEAIFSKSG